MWREGCFDAPLNADEERTFKNDAVATIRGNQEEVLLKMNKSRLAFVPLECTECRSGYEHKIFEGELCGEGWLRIIEGGEEELCEHHITEFQENKSLTLWMVLGELCGA